jgi:enoyl-[acyl-carrier protein] reductase I
MNFLRLEGKKVLITGVANKKSIAWHVSRILEEAGADLYYAVKDKVLVQKLSGMLPEDRILVCDVEHKEQIDELADALSEKTESIDGLLHAIAFASYSDGMRPFHQVSRDDFIQAFNISCYSLIALSDALKRLLNNDASVVTLSIARTDVASNSYGYMGPVKAALESTIVYLAQSFSRFSSVRFNAVKAGPVKTSAAAGIPGFVDTYLYAEELTLRKRALETREVAAAAAFLLSPASSGINAQGIVVDAGMTANVFDEEVVRRVSESNS